MSATTTIPASAKSRAPFDNTPAEAHAEDLAHTGPDVRALCGARLIGVPAPASAPRCAECTRLWETRE